MPGTTPRGYPYPLPTEPVAEGAQAIRNLADKIDAASGMDLLERVTLAANGTINFAALGGAAYPGGLRLSCYLRSAAAAPSDVAHLRFNGDASAAYSGQQILGSGPSALAAQSLPPLTFGRIGVLPAATFPVATSWAALDVLIPNHRSGGQKSWIAHGFGGFTSVYAVIIAGGVWNNVAPITALSVLAETAPGLLAGSTVSLYGLR